MMFHVASSGPAVQQIGTDENFIRVMSAILGVPVGMLHFFL